MKNLTGTILLGVLSIAFAMAETPDLPPSIKLAMIDTSTKKIGAIDTIIADTLCLKAPIVRHRTDWHYESTFMMPDPSLQGWWHGFNDSLLDSLITLAVKNNNDIRMAAHRIDLARLGVRQTRSGYFPTISAQAGRTEERNSAFISRHKGVVTENSYFTVGLAANWEIDIFGRIRKQAEVKNANFEESKANYTAALVSLCSQLTEYYIQLRVYQAQMEVAYRLGISQQEVLRIANVRHECKLASGLDVSQAKSVYLSTQSTIPTLQTEISHCINAISVLLGTSDKEIICRLSQVKPIPIYSMPLDIDITPELLRRRPDVQASEMQVAALAAQIGVSKKAFLPTLSLEAEIGADTHSLKNLFKKEAFTYSVQPVLNWTIFSGMTRRYAVAEAKQQMLIGIDEYNLTVQNAAAEVENALIGYRNSVRRIGMLNELLGESLKSFDFSLDQYKQGLSPFLNVVNAQIDVLNYNNQLVQERGDAQISIMQLYKALGGGW